MDAPLRCFPPTRPSLTPTSLPYDWTGIPAAPIPLPAYPQAAAAIIWGCCAPHACCRKARNIGFSIAILETSFILVSDVHEGAQG